MTSKREREKKFALANVYWIEQVFAHFCDVNGIFGSNFIWTFRLGDVPNDMPSKFNKMWNVYGNFDGKKWLEAVSFGVLNPQHLIEEKKISSRAFTIVWKPWLKIDDLYQMICTIGKNAFSFYIRLSFTIRFVYKEICKREKKQHSFSDIDWMTISVEWISKAKRSRTVSYFILPCWMFPSAIWISLSQQFFLGFFNGLSYFWRIVVCCCSFECIESLDTDSQNKNSTPFIYCQFKKLEDIIII